MNRMGFGRYHRVTLRRTLPVAVTSLLAVVATPRLRTALFTRERRTRLSNGT